MTTTTLTDRWTAQRKANQAVLARWAENASGGLLTIDADTDYGALGVSFRRVDGAVVSCGGDTIISGLIVDLYVPNHKPIDNRFRTVKAELVDALWAAGKRLLSEDELATMVGARWNWCRSNGLKS